MKKIFSISAIVIAGLVGASSLAHAEGSSQGSEASNGQGGTTAKAKKMNSGMSHGGMSKSNGSMAQRSQTDAPAAMGSDTPTKNKRMDMTKGQGGTSGTPMPATSATGNK